MLHHVPRVFAVAPAAPRARRLRGKSVSKPIALERLESRELLTSSPIGSVDLVTRTQVAGWAMNADDGAGAVNVEITVNGTKATLSANASRADLATPLGSPYHAYNYTLPSLPPGVSTILVEAVSASTGARTTLKSTTLTNPLPVGHVDVFSTTRIAGWVADSDSGSPIKFRVDVDGLEVTNTLTTVSRPDVAAVYGVSNAGFDITGSFSGKVIEVYAIDSPSDQATLIYTNNRTPVGSVDVSDGFTVAGWVVDPDNQAASGRIRVDIDGVTLIGSPFTASLTRNDLQAVYGSTNHGYNVTIPGLTPGDHTIDVYAIDLQALSAAPVLLGSKTVTNRAPGGNIDVVNANVIAGWALDQDTPNSASTVNIYVDDTLFSTFSASLARQDLVPFYNSANHGFSVNLGGLTGSHSITVTVIDNRTSDENEVVIYDDFINNTVPIGTVDKITGSKLYGWAYDADAPGTGIAVDIYVDGVYAATTNANLARADVDTYLGSANHAFAADLPTLTFGEHKIDVYAAESQGNVSVLIGSTIVTNNRPIGSIDLASTTTLAGWAADPDRLGESMDVKVYINNVLVTTATAGLSRGDLLNAAALSGTGNFSAYGYSITLPALASGRNQIDVYAVDKNNGMLSPLGSKVITV
jgi:hypothetical protein